MVNFKKLIDNTLLEMKQSGSDIIQLPEHDGWVGIIPLTYEAYEKYWSLATPGQYNKEMELIVLFTYNEDPKKKFKLYWTFNKSYKEWVNSKNKTVYEPFFYSPFSNDVRNQYYKAYEKNSLEEFLSKSYHPLKLIPTFDSETINKINTDLRLAINCLTYGMNPKELAQIFKTFIPTDEAKITDIIRNGTKKKELIDLFKDKLKNFSLGNINKIIGALDGDLRNYLKDIVKGQSAYYDKVGKLTNGFHIVRKNNKLGFIDANGKEIIKPIYDDVNPFDEEGKAWISREGKQGYVYKNGKEELK